MFMRQTGSQLPLKIAFFGEFGVDLHLTQRIMSFCYSRVQPSNSNQKLSNRRAWDVACVCREPIELTEDEVLSVVSDFGDVSMVPK